MFKKWSYRKHARFITGFYLTSYAIDMTLGYLLIKRTFDEEGKVIR